MAAINPNILVEHIFVPRELPEFIRSLVGLPNNPASLYLSVGSRSLIIYVEPISTIRVIDLLHLNDALIQDNESALALKSILETGTAKKVFFDARMPAKILFDRCGIKLGKVCAEGAHIHEVQMMELALRHGDPGRKWLASFDKCITQDLGYNITKSLSSSPAIVAGIDPRIVHLPGLWKKYHDQLVKGRESFWVSMIRQATQKRLGVSRGETHLGYDVDSAKSGWHEEIIEEQMEDWNEDVFMDDRHNGDWVGGREYWAKFSAL